MYSKKFLLVALSLMSTLFLQANDPNSDPFFQDPFGDDIFKEMMQMQKNMDKMFNKMNNRIQQRSANLMSPGTYKINNTQHFIDKGKYYELVTNIPENKENQIDLNAKDGVLSLTAKIIQKHENKSKNGFSSSSSMQMYQQNMPIPSDADEGSMKASYNKDKKLVITMDKKSTIKKDNNNTKEQNSTKQAYQL